MIAMVCLLTQHRLKESEEEEEGEEEKNINWAGQDAICMEHGKRTGGRKKYKLSHSFPPFSYCCQ
jgi:hypothetical protein